MATQVQNRRGSTAEHSTFTGAVGEVTIDTDKDTAVVHDGSTAGGRPLLREDLSNLPAGQNVTTTGTSTAARFIPTSSTAPTNGLYLNAANSVALSSNGNGRLFINSSGSIGVGISNPISTLHVDGTGSPTIRVSSSTYSNFLQMVCGSGSTFHEYKSVYRLVDTDSGERLRITSTGLVGIGTSAPSSTLEVNGTITAQGNISAISGGATRTITLGNAGAGLEYNVDGTTYLGGRTDAWPLVLRTNSQPRITITADGVLGYNQPAPAAVDATATLTVANLKTGIITSSTAAAVTMTLPTGTLTEGGFAANSLYNNFTFEWTVINTGATNAVTVQGGTDHTLVGSGTIAAGVSGRFASRRTATNTFVTYRLS